MRDVVVKPLPWLALVLSVAAGFVILDTLRATVELYHPLPYWDSWDFVADLKLYAKGDYGIERLWMQHNEHRILFPRLFYFVDGLWFSCRGAFLIVCTVVLQLLHVYVLFCLVRRSGMLKRTEQWIIASLLAATLFSSVQMKNFIWSFQVQFVLVYLAVTTATLWLLKHKSALQSEAGTLARFGWLAASIAAAVVANYTMANGILVWPLLFVLGIHLRLPMRSVVALGAAGALFGGLYLLGYESPPALGSPMNALGSPLQVLWGTACFLGSPLKYLGETAVVVAGGVSLVGFAAFTVLTLRRRRSATPAELGLVYLLAFLVGTALVIALGRSRMGLGALLASRYGTTSLLFWACLLSLVVLRCAAAPGARSVKWASYGLVAAWVMSLALSQRYEVRRFADFRETQSLATMALMTGVCDEAALQKTHGVPVKYTLSRAGFLRSRRLSVFAEGWHLLIGKRATDYAVVSEEPLPLGSFDGVFQVASDGAGRRVTGWSWNPETGAPYEHIVLLDDQDRIIGLAASGFSRPDVARAHPQVGEKTGWQGYVRLLDEPEKGSGLVFAAAVDPDSRTLRRLANSRSFAGIRMAPLESLGSLLECDEVELSGGWSENGQYKPSATPPKGGKVYGSWSGKDSNHGELRIAVNVPANSSVGVPVLTGPDTRGVSLRVLTADTGKEIANWRAPPPSDQWFVWRVDLPEASKPQRLMIIARDDGQEWGQWFALATPRRIPAD